MKILAQIEGENIALNNDGTVTYLAKAAIDTDGSGPLHGDPDGQHRTSLQHNGKSLNADEDRYIVVPPQIIKGVGPVVLGCQGWACNRKTGACSAAVVGDVGPHSKLGEVSVALAKALGINPSPTSGGEDSHIIEYTLTPGKPAEVNGKIYSLQAS